MEVLYQTNYSAVHTERACKTHEQRGYSSGERAPVDMLSAKSRICCTDKQWKSGTVRSSRFRAFLAVIEEMMYFLKRRRSNDLPVHCGGVVWVSGHERGCEEEKSKAM